MGAGGDGVEGATRLRRYSVGLLKSLHKPAQSIAATMRKVTFNTRRLFDYARMTQNAITRSPAQ